MSSPRVVEVTWGDHTFKFGEYAQDQVNNDITVVKTLGYFVREDDEVIVVALSLSDGKPSDVQVIDKRMMKGRPRTVRRAIS